MVGIPGLGAGALGGTGWLNPPPEAASLSPGGATLGGAAYAAAAATAAPAAAASSAASSAGLALEGLGGRAGRRAGLVGHAVDYRDPSARGGLYLPDDRCVP